MCRKLGIVPLPGLAAAPAFAADCSATIEANHAFFCALPGHVALMKGTLSPGK
jgi:azurin